MSDRVAPSSEFQLARSRHAAIRRHRSCCCGIPGNGASACVGLRKLHHTLAVLISKKRAFRCRKTAAALKQKDRARSAFLAGDFPRANDRGHIEARSYIAVSHALEAAFCDYLKGAQEPAPGHRGVLRRARVWRPEGDGGLAQRFCQPPDCLGDYKLC